MQAIYVAPNSWSKGVGRGLWDVAQYRLRERGFNVVTLWVLELNERAIRFYRAAGLTPDGAPPRSITLGGAQLKQVRYRLAQTAIFIPGS